MITVEGNFTQTCSGELVFVVDAANNKSASLNVTGCLSLNQGNITLNLVTQPQRAISSLEIISYNCSHVANVSQSQIQVIPSYKGGECDTINSQVMTSSSAVSVSLTSTLGNKCGGVSKTLIISLSVGIPCTLTIIVSLIIAIMRYKQKKKIVEVTEEMTRRKCKKYLMSEWLWKKEQ